MIAITGITGHTGGFLLQQFVDNGYDAALRCMVREHSDTSKLDDSGLRIDKFHGSIDDVDDLCGFLDGADTLIHVAGIWRTPKLLEAMDRLGTVRHAVLVHTTGIYSKHKMASEEYKQIEQDMQKYLDGGMNITILRPTMIFGDMRDKNVSKYIRMVDRYKLMPEIDRGRGLIQPVNARDLGQALYKAAMHETLQELSYNISGERALTLHELCELIGGDLGKRTGFISCPMALGVAGAWLVKTATGGKKDLVEKVLRMGEDRSFSHEPATRDFGYQPEKFEDGLKREVEEYLANGRR